MGIIRFGIPRQIVLWMRDTLGVETFVETGTYHAATAVWASENFKQVFTIEAYEPLYLKAVEKFGSRANIQFLKGDSRGHLQSLADSLTKPAIFWLDAHWCGNLTFGAADGCPLADELRVLALAKVPHLILIDDARLFLTTPAPPMIPEQWPDISSICRLLERQDSNPHIIVLDDVIIAVPNAYKPVWIDYLREEALRVEAKRTGRKPPLKRFAARVARRLDRWSDSTSDV